MTSENLARAITEVTLNADVDPNTIFEALQIVFMFWLSCLCDDCRRGIAHRLRTSIPAMLESANRAAEHFDQVPTCH
jgi:hypothetical protein